MPIQRTQAIAAIRDLLIALGHDPEQEPEFAATPERVVAAYIDDLLKGEQIDVAHLVAKESIPCEPTTGLVVVQDIAVATLCPHHLLPAEGSATVAFLPGERLLGLGTVTAVVDACARRFILQERIAELVVDTLMEELKAKGAFCRLVLRHGCMRLRGERQSTSSVTTTAIRGSFTLDPGLLFLALNTGAPPL